MNYLWPLIIPITFLAGLIPSTTTYTAPELAVSNPVAEVSQVEVNSLPPLVSEAVEPIKLKVSPIECSCVRYAQLLAPEIPLFNAVDFPVNTITPQVGDIIKLQYYNATTSRYISHIAVIKKITGETYTFDQGNKLKCATSTETIKKTSENIIGFFSVPLWREISKLSKEQQAVLKCESNFSHYKQSAIIRGDAGEIGIAQFMKNTWKFATELRRKEKNKEILLDIWSAEDQIKQFVYLWDKGYDDYWYAKDSECYKNAME